jgi:hypothetical protein
MLGGSTAAQIRFSYGSSYGWYQMVDNVKVYEPAPFDVGCTAILSPAINPTNCLAGLSSTETITCEWTNFGSAPVNVGDLVTINVDLDTINVLSEPTSPTIAVPAAGTYVQVTTGTVDLSALGAHVLDVSATYTLGDFDPSNDKTTLAYNLPGHTPNTFGWSENFDSLTPVTSGLPPTNYDVPANWTNGTTGPNATVQGWAPSNYSTPSAYGPSNDHTTGAAGNYMYVEDSYDDANDLVMDTPCLDTAGALGSPTLNFWHVSRTVAGASNDNVLFVDVIDVTSGNTLTMGVASFAGNGNTTWMKHSLDLSAFAPNIVKVRFRSSNNNLANADDQAIDDLFYFDAIAPTGQAPQAGNAVFDINGALNGLGNPVTSGENGPYLAGVNAGGTMSMDWSGQNNGIVICLFGPPATNISSIAGVGQFDIGAPPVVSFIPSALFVFGDGSTLFPFGPLFNSFFFTGPAGTGGVSFQIPAFAPGPLTRFQCVMNPAGMFYLSNAVDVDVLP